MGVTLKRTVLYDNHIRAHAKLGEFGGWEMPLSYPLGTVGEHMATRTGAAIFDVSHLGTVRVEGVGSYDRLQHALTNDLSKISVGRAQYTHLLDDETGSVTDDIIVWWTDDDGFDVMPNASNTQRVLEVTGGVDATRNRAIIALQGPKWREVILPIISDAAHVSHFSVARLNFRGSEIKVAGTGYTGEEGIELNVPNEIAPVLWDQLIANGATAAGLGARDTLRLEAGLPLHGHELGKDISPYQVGLGWVVSMAKDSFFGKQALIDEKKRGISRKLVGLKGTSRQPFRQGQEILKAGRNVGNTTSGSFSPVLGVGIALGFVEPSCEVGESLEIEVRGNLLPVEIVKLPFVDKAYSK